MLDDAMDAIEHDNPALGGVLPEDKMRRLVAQWREQQAEAARLDAERCQSASSRWAWARPALS